MNETNELLKFYQSDLFSLLYTSFLFFFLVMLASIGLNKALIQDSNDIKLLSEKVVSKTLSFLTIISSLCLILLFTIDVLYTGYLFWQVIM